MVILGASAYIREMERREAGVIDAGGQELQGVDRECGMMAIRVYHVQIDGVYQEDHLGALEELEGLCSQLNPHVVLLFQP